jgi:hypothetical protein
MAHAMSRVLVSSAPASHWPAGCSSCDSFDGMSVSGVHDKCFAEEGAVTVTGEVVWAGGDILWVDSQPTKPCCTLPGHSE